MCKRNFWSEWNEMLGRNVGQITLKKKKIAILNLLWWIIFGVLNIYENSDVSIEFYPIKNHENIGKLGMVWCKGHVLLLKVNSKGISKWILLLRN